MEGDAQAVNAMSVNCGIAVVLRSSLVLVVFEIWSCNLVCGSCNLVLRSCFWVLWYLRSCGPAVGAWCSCGACWSGSIGGRFCWKEEPAELGGIDEE